MERIQTIFTGGVILIFLSGWNLVICKIPGRSVGTPLFPTSKQYYSTFAIFVNLQWVPIFFKTAKLLYSSAASVKPTIVHILNSIWCEKISVFEWAWIAAVYQWTFFTVTSFHQMTIPNFHLNRTRRINPNKKVLLFFLDKSARHTLELPFCLCVTKTTCTLYVLWVSPWFNMM